MDWAKTKNVLIVVFLLLNIFLAFHLLLTYKGDSGLRKNAVNAVKILEERGVVLKCKIPQISDAHRINYENASLDKSFIASVLLGNGEPVAYDAGYGEEQSKGSKSLVFNDSSFFTYTDSNPTDVVNISDQEKTIKYCAKFLNSLELPVSDYYTDEYIIGSDGSVHIKLLEKYNNYIIFSNEFKMDVSGNGITRLECKLVKVDRKQKNKINNIVPAYQILLRHYVEGGNAAISDIEIGFDCTYLEKGKSSITYPIWRVRSENGKTRFFSAMDGTEKKM